MRIAHYERVYEPITEDVPYVKYVDVGRQVYYRITYNRVY